MFWSYEKHCYIGWQNLDDGRTAFYSYDSDGALIDCEDVVDLKGEDPADYIFKTWAFP